MPFFVTAWLCYLFNAWGSQAVVTGPGGARALCFCIAVMLYVRQPMFFSRKIYFRKLISRSVILNWWVGTKKWVAGPFLVNRGPLPNPADVLIIFQGRLNAINAKISWQKISKWQVEWIYIFSDCNLPIYIEGESRNYRGWEPQNLSKMKKNIRISIYILPVLLFCYFSLLLKLSCVIIVLSTLWLNVSIWRYICYVMLHMFCSHSLTQKPVVTSKCEKVLF